MTVIAARPSPYNPLAWSPRELLERTRRRMRTRRLSPRTEDTYLGWIRRYIEYHGRHPAALGRVELQRFLDHLADEVGVGAPSQNQASSAVVFLYRELYGQDFGGSNGVVRARMPRVLPKYATPAEVDRVLAGLNGEHRLAAMIMYGSGTRIAETMAIRLQDVSLETRDLHIRGGKGGWDRTTLIAEAAVGALTAQITRVREIHPGDRADGGGWAPLPDALHRKDPKAGWDPGWQYLFPAARATVDPKTGHPGRTHRHHSTTQRAIKKASRAAGTTRPVSCHVLRHCFATEMLKSGCDIRLLQRLMGHRNLRTTQRYLHVLDRPGIGLVSPLDRLPSVRGAADAGTS